MDWFSHFENDRTMRIVLAVMGALLVGVSLLIGSQR